MSIAKQLRVRPKVLCIDDDPAIVTAMKVRLSEFNVDVLAAFFGTQGIWLAATERPDVIVTDMRMPNGTGDYVVECLKARTDTCGIPVIVLTGCRDRDSKRWMQTLGVACHLYKPVSFKRVLEAVAKYIALETRAC